MPIDGFVAVFLVYLVMYPLAIHTPLEASKKHIALLMFIARNLARKGSK